ncbi:MAG TPA: non-homologous end-joining DNA ligase [Acidimicrobiales bacterium]|nr:non-homologous end-joining DNA ligase [Acidimicrobiales bacterium]
MRAEDAGGALEGYRAKRDFTVTPEPAGGSADQGAAPRFVVQRHRARRLHYDLRLEMDGVLVSWAVPKGPTLDPAARHAAFHVEDHPIEYRDFEGVIPAGEYGGGDVIVWDRGTWEPARPGDPVKAVADGEIHFDLHGQKLRGRFVLVRTRTEDNGRGTWLLLHKRDDDARPGWDPEEHPRSVKSGRTNDEVAADPHALWHGDRPAAEAEVRLDASPPARAGAAEEENGSASPPEWRSPDPDELAALDALGGSGTWILHGRELRLTNLDKVLFPGRADEQPVTKRDLVRYYTCVAPVILPYLVGRPVNQHRYPNGVDKPGFWHKEIPDHAPEWITRWHNDEADPGETEWYAVVDSAPTLAWMANFAAVELHAWTSRLPDVHQPTWALIDIDPGTDTAFSDVVLLARLYRSGLEHLGVEGMPKVTGGRGLHIWVPIAPGYSFDDTRAWVEGLSRAVGATVPELVSWTWEKRSRHGRARLDYTQNAINKTLVAPYGVRAAPGAPVSLPIEWTELDDPDLRSDRWTIRSVPQRLATVGDPFSRLLHRPQQLPPI